LNCAACGHENLEGNRFCGGCGAPLARACPACQSANPPDHRFCGACGSPLAAAVRAPASPPPLERSPRDYTPKHLADRILRSKSALEGERKQVTILFADVKSSMELAASIDPEEWHAILDRFFQILADGVHRFDTVNQYTGDGIMALFGAPIAHEDHAQRACWAALHLRDELRRYGDELRIGRGLNFTARMGLNSGEVVVGEIASPFFRAQGSAALARAHLGAGDHDRARAVAREALALCARFPDLRSPRLGASAAAAHVLLRTDGASAEALGALEQAESLAAAIPDRFFEASVRLERAELARLRGDEAGRRRLRDEAQRMFVEIGASGHAERVKKEIGA